MNCGLSPIKQNLNNISLVNKSNLSDLLFLIEREHEDIINKSMAQSSSEKRNENFSMSGDSNKFITNILTTLEKKNQK